MEGNPGKTHLINFSLRKVISEISIAMYGQPLKVPSPVKFLGVIIGNHSSMKLRMEHVERARLVDRMNITVKNVCETKRGLWLYSSNHTKQVTKTQTSSNSKSLSTYARRIVDSTCLYNDELRLRHNIVSVGQRIFTLAKKKFRRW